MGCSGSVSLGPKLSLVLNRARTPGALSSAVVVRNVEARDEEPNVDKSFGDKDQKIDVFELPPQKALID